MKISLENIKNIPKIIKNSLFPKKTGASAEIVTFEDPTGVESKYHIHQGRLIPTEINLKSLSESQIKAYPLVNEPMAMSGVILHPYGIPQVPDAKMLWTYVKSTPEIVALFSAIVEDIISDGYILEGKPLHKKRAKDFLEENRFNEVMTAVLWDSLGSGNGYIYKAGVSRTSVKRVLKKITGRLQIKSMEAKSIWADLKQDDEIFGIKKFIDVPSSTMKIIYSTKGGMAKGYIQKVATKTAKFTPDEIIHFRFLKLEGKIYGFTPLSSILKEIDILSNVKDLARYYFEKGGVPNYMYILKNETTNSATYKAFKKSIQLYASLANKYKSLIVTGEVEAKELNRMGKDMEFRELARYLTQVMVMVWGVPANRLSDLLINKAQRGATVSSEGYYRKISHLQDIVEELVNSQLLKGFDVSLRFNRTYKQDEVREVQIEKIKTDVAEQRIFLNVWDYNTAAKYLKVPDDIIKKLQPLWKKKEKQELEDLTKPQRSKKRGGSRQYGQEQLNRQQMLSESPEKAAQDLDKQGAALQKKSDVYGKQYSKSYIIQELEKDKIKVTEVTEDA